MALCKASTRGHRIDGPWAWLVCFSGAFMNGIHFGLLSSFSVLLPIWSEEFKTSRGTTAWIGSLALGSTFLFSPFTIKAINSFGERLTGVVIGLIGAGLLIGSSLARNIIILYFTHGVLLGICGNITMNIALLSPTKYFKKRLALAIGIAGSGGSVGFMIFPPILQALVDSFGWRNGLRVLLVTMLMVSIVSTINDGNIEKESEESVECNSASRKRKEEEKYSSDSKKENKHSGSCFDCCSVLNSRKYTIGLIAIWLAFFGLYVPAVHLISYAKDNNISGSKSSFLFTFIGVCSATSQVLFGKLIDKKWLTPIQGVQTSTLILGVSILLFTLAKKLEYFIPLAILYGSGNGGLVSTQTVFFLTCFDDMKKNANGYSIAHIIKAMGLFIGPPIAGTIADYFHSYIPAFYIFGGLIILASALPLFLRLNKDGPEIQDTKSIQLLEGSHDVVEYHSGV